MGIFDGVGEKIGAWVGKGVIKGYVKRQCQSWTLDDLLDLAKADKGITHLFATHPAIAMTLQHAARNSQPLRDLTVAEFLRWLKEGNELLHGEILENPQIISWFHRVWERDRGVFLAEHSLPKA